MSNQEEIWKDVIGYEGLYQVSNFGRIKRTSTNKLRLSGNNSKGYLFVPLCKNGIVKNHYIHRIVAESFLINPLNKSTVNHKNGIKSDNNTANLEWCTQSENSQHGFNTGLICQKRGADNPNSKSVIQYSLNGVYLNKYDSIADAGNITKIFPQNISFACNGKYKHAGGFIWKYAKL